MKGDRVAVITKLFPNGSLVSGITSSKLLNNYSDSGVLVHHIAVAERSNTSFCTPLCHIKRLCIVVGISGDNMLTVRLDHSVALCLLCNRGALLVLRSQDLILLGLGCSSSAHGPDVVDNMLTLSTFPNLVEHN